MAQRPDPSGPEFPELIVTDCQYDRVVVGSRRRDEVYAQLTLSFLGTDYRVIDTDPGVAAGQLRDVV